MTEEKNKDKAEGEQQQNQNIQFHVPPELEYVYRDVFNVYADMWGC